MSGAELQRVRTRIAGRDPDVVRGMVRALWLAGGDTNSITTALGTSRATVAEKLLQLDEAELLEGLRANLDGLVVAKAEGRKMKRTTKA